MTELSHTINEKSLLSAFVNFDPETLPKTDYVPDRVTVSRRELSLIVERLLMALGCPQGVWPGARDFVLETVGEVGVDALTAFESALLEKSETQEWPSVKFEGDNELSASGAPLMLIGDSVANAMLAFFADHPRETFLVRGMSSTAGFEGLRVRAAFHGFALTIAPNSAAGTLLISASPIEKHAQADCVQTLKNGLSISGVQWWRLYQPSNFALSEETEISRLHTGVSETLLHYAV